MTEINFHKNMARNVKSTEGGQKEIEFFTRYLREKAHYYYINLKSGNFNVKYVGSSERPQSRLYRYCVSANGRKYSLLIKIPLVHKRISSVSRIQGEQSIIERPRLVPITEQQIKSELEYKALSEISEYFTGLTDPRFASVRVLDYIQDFDAILMEDVTLPSLNKLFFKASRLWFPFAPKNLHDSCRNAGAWLRMYHQLSKEDVQLRNSKRSDYIDSMTDYTKFLGTHLKDDIYFDNIAKKLKITAMTDLPESLPVGLAHGDFAMRNILVGSNSQVLVLDTLARWRSPIFEDISHFLIGLRTAGIIVFTCGLAFSNNFLQQYEREFLLGYFGNKTIPYSTIRLFEIQALLDKWSARLVDLKLNNRRGSIPEDYLKFLFYNRSFRELLNRKVSEVY